MFDTPIPTISIVMLAISFAGIVICCLYGWQAYFRASKPQDPDVPEGDEYDSDYPSASVIVYADCPEAVLDRTIESMTQEDYPDFEIIVVCDAMRDQADLLNERYAMKYDNVYVTFIPQGSHNVSRRKLAITSGVKAAKGEIIVTTTGNVELPESHRWLRTLLSPFFGYKGKSTDVSLGLSRIPLKDLSGYGRWYKEFDSVLTNALWIGYATMGKAFRGDGYNLAFRRSVFIEHKGYARTINLHNGDDDLFISEISKPGNTQVVITPDTVLPTVWPDGADVIWTNRKEGYNFTEKWLRKGPFIREFVSNLMQWIIPGAAVTGFLTALPNLIGLILGVVVILIYWAFETWLYLMLAKNLCTDAKWYRVMPFWTFRLPANIIFRILHHRRSKLNFTWVRTS